MVRKQVAVIIFFLQLLALGRSSWAQNMKVLDLAGLSEEWVVPSLSSTGLFDVDCPKRETAMCGGSGEAMAFILEDLSTECRY